MLQAKRFLRVLTAVTICMAFTAGFTTRAASLMPVAVPIDTSHNSMDKRVPLSVAKKVPADRLTETKRVVGVAKSEYDTQQKRKVEEEKKKADEARQIAELAKKAEAEVAAKRTNVLSVELTGQADDTKLLAGIIFCEAGNQPYEGQVAVGAVIMNRVRSGAYPNSIAEVIYQSGQFGPAITGWLDSVLASGSYTETAMQAATDAMGGANPVGDSLYFGNGNYGIQIGDHFFH